MLKFYRKNIKLFIWLIVLSFAAWGIGTITTSQSNASLYVGSLGGEKISHKEFLTTLRYYELLTRAQARAKNQPQDQNKGTNAETPKSEPLSFDELRGLTWQAILLSREARREAIAVADEEVRSEIEKQFSVEGQFNQEFYQNWIRNNFRGRARDFEEVVRKHLAAQKIRSKILENVPESERDARWLEWLRSAISRARIEDYTIKTENNSQGGETSLPAPLIEPPKVKS